MRWLFAFSLLAGCYQAASVSPCTLTCDPATPCPGDLVCGTEGVCQAPGSIGCSLIDAGTPDGADGASDAAPDAGFVVADDCPATYNISVPSTTATSRYRVITMSGAFWIHETECAVNLPGATHLASLQTTLERDELASVADAVIVGSGAYVYVGAVQKANASNANLGWLAFDGQPLDAALWANGSPLDGTDGETGHDAQVALLDTTMGLIDVRGTIQIQAVCECDGIPIDATARTYIETDPNNPN
jgi:hypothetical protein